LGYCATEAHGWARGGASASAAAMTSLLWNAQTGEAPAGRGNPIAIGREGALPRGHAGRLDPGHSTRVKAHDHVTTPIESHAKLLNLGQCSLRYK
ncbi:unnamed protein product, partial [Ixodes hexagonus]